MSARRRLLVGLALAAASLGAAELGVRLFVLPNEKLVWRPLPPFTGQQTEEQLAWLARQSGDDANASAYGRFDPVLGWSQRPSSASPDGAVHIDARGRRSAHAYAEPTPEGTRRVVVCGDSFTFGEEVSDADTWAARLEVVLPRCEVWNYGVGGYGTDQALMRVQREVEGPVEVLLVGLLLENIGRNVNRYRPLWYPSALPAVKPRYVPSAVGLELVPQPFATRAEFLAAVRDGTVLERCAEHEFWSDPFVPAPLAWSAIARLFAARSAYRARDIEILWADPAGEPFRTTLALLEAFRGAAQGLGARRWGVLVFPSREDVAARLELGAPYWQELLTALGQREIEHLDLSDALTEAARAEGGVTALYRASHYSPHGNEIVAEAVRAWLAPQLDD